MDRTHEIGFQIALVRVVGMKGEIPMANKAKKTEHAGHKGSGRKGGYWGRRAEAKAESRKLRRANGKAVVREALRNPGAHR